MRFAAIDFETADHGRDSACAVGIVRVEDGRVVERAYRLIRPPRDEFLFTWVHGITWDDVEGEATFRDLWPGLERLVVDVDFLAAHNAGFDRAVLNACCEAAGLAPPPPPFECTVKMARKVWNIRPTRLDDVCRVLSIPLEHHHAASDAEACARIVMTALAWAGEDALALATPPARGARPRGSGRRRPSGGEP